MEQKSTWPQERTEQKLTELAPISSADSGDTADSNKRLKDEAWRPMCLFLDEEQKVTITQSIITPFEFCGQDLVTQKRDREINIY